MRIDVFRLIQRWARRAFRPAPQVTSVASPEPIIRLPGTHIAAGQSLVDRVAIDSMEYRKRLLFADIEKAHPDILAFSRAFQKDLAKRGMPLFAHCYYRGADLQNALYDQGVTKAKFGDSPHNYGMAVDIVHYSKFWDLTPRQWDVIGIIGKEVARKRNLRITWGGDWEFYDPAHWELTNWRKERGKIRSQSREKQG